MHVIVHAQKGSIQYARMPDSRTYDSSSVAVRLPDRWMALDSERALMNSCHRRVCTLGSGLDESGRSASEPSEALYLICTEHVRVAFPDRTVDTTGRQADRWPLRLALAIGRSVSSHAQAQLCCQRSTASMRITRDLKWLGCSPERAALMTSEN